VIPSSPTVEIYSAAMKRPSTKDKTQKRRLAAYRKARDQTKLDLIKAAREAEKDNQWPEYLWPDINDDAWFRRKSAISELVEKRGGFSNHVTVLALTDRQWETKETVASWLRAELKALRDAESEAGTAPVRRGGALSRTAISDIAVELLECIAGESLVCLFQELLEIDRHRKSLAADFISLENAAGVEAQQLLQGKQLGVRSFAKQMGVAPSTVTRWRTSPAFRQRVNFHQGVWDNVLREEYFDEIKRDEPELTEADCFRRAFELYASSIPERRLGKYGPKKRALSENDSSS
jgi:hypothetical protein